VSALAVEYEDEVEEPLPVLRLLGFRDLACGVCGWRFFTSTALREHEADCNDCPPSLPQIAAWRKDLHRAATHAYNAKRRACLDCGMVSTPAALGSHLWRSGHSGWTDL
jgi:hypothetical protein